MVSVPQSFERQRLGQVDLLALLEPANELDREPARFEAIGGSEGRISHSSAYPIHPLKRAAWLVLLDPNFQPPDAEREGPAAALALVPGAFRNWESPFSHPYLHARSGWRPAEHRRWDRTPGGVGRQRQRAFSVGLRRGRTNAGRRGGLAACLVGAGDAD